MTMSLSIIAFALTQWSSKNKLTDRHNHEGMLVVDEDSHQRRAITQS